MTFLLRPGGVEATRPEATEDGCGTLTFRRLQQPLGAHSLVKPDVFMYAYLELSTMGPRVWGF